MTNEEAIKILINSAFLATVSKYEDIEEAIRMAVSALGAIDQIQWERDLAIKQLHDLGYGLGEKPREEVKKSNQEVKKSNQEVKKSDLQSTCNKLQQVASDTISRQAAIDAVENIDCSDLCYQVLPRTADIYA